MSLSWVVSSLKLTLSESLMYDCNALSKDIMLKDKANDTCTTYITHTYIGNPLKTVHTKGEKNINQNRITNDMYLR